MGCTEARVLDERKLVNKVLPDGMTLRGVAAASIQFANAVVLQVLPTRLRNELHLSGGRTENWKREREASMSAAHAHCQSRWKQPIGDEKSRACRKFLEIASQLRSEGEEPRSDEGSEEQLRSFSNACLRDLCVRLEAERKKNTHIEVILTITKPLARIDLPPQIQGKGPRAGHSSSPSRTASDLADSKALVMMTLCIQRSCCCSLHRYGRDLGQCASGNPASCSLRNLGHLATSSPVFLCSKSLAPSIQDEQE